MIEVCRIAVALARGSVIALSTAGEGGFASGDLVFHDQSIVAQVARRALDMHLIEVPVK